MSHENVSLSPENVALLARINEMNKEARISILADVRKETEERLALASRLSAAAADGFTAPTPAPAAEPTTDAAPAAEPKTPVSKRITERFNAMFQNKAKLVPFTKKEAIEAVANGTATVEMVATATDGIMVAGIEAAFNSGIVTGPKRGLTGWQVLGVGLAAGVVTGAAVIGADYAAAKMGVAFRPVPHKSAK
jgi:hypothetical protein